MARAEWTYQVAPAGAPAAGLEEYVVETSSGAHVGKVTTLLRREDELLVAVERGLPPATHDVRVFPWRDVASIDHSALKVRLNVGESDVEDAVELDPGKGIEDGNADAIRVTELPPDLTTASSPAEPGPVDRPTTAVALALGLLGLFSVLIVVIVVASVDSNWDLVLFVVPAAFLIASGVVAYRLFRKPYERV